MEEPEQQQGDAAAAPAAATPAPAVDWAAAVAGVKSMDKFVVKRLTVKKKRKVSEDVRQQLIDIQVHTVTYN